MKRWHTETAAELAALLPASLTAPSKERCENDALKNYGATIRQTSLYSALFRRSASRGVLPNCGES
jgi:hypothetical protein